MIISYKGESLETNHWCELSDDVFAELKKAYYAKPNIDYVKSQKKWRARLNYNKQCYDLGRFNTAEEAHEAREQKRHELGLVDMNKFTKGE